MVVTFQFEVSHVLISKVNKEELYPKEYSNFVTAQFSVFQVLKFKCLNEVHC